MAYSSCSQFPIFLFNFTLQCASRIWHKYTIVSADQQNILRRNYAFYTWSSLCEKCPLNGRVKTDKNTTNTFEKAHRGAHIVYHPTPGYFLAHQKACCERRFRHMSHHFLLFLSQNGLMKGGHFVICIGTCSPSKLGQGWELNLLYLCVCVCACSTLTGFVLPCRPSFPLKESIISVWCVENW